MRCQICDNLTENSEYNEKTGMMDSICNKCKGSIRDTITEDQIDDEDDSLTSCTFEGFGGRHD